MSFTVTRSLPSPSLPNSNRKPPFHQFSSNAQILNLKLKPRLVHPLLASRRISNFPRVGPDSLADGPRNWNRSITSEFDDDEDDDDDDDDEAEEEDRSLDLFVRFVQNVFRKISKRARKAVRTVLPLFIPTKLVRFSVDGVLMLAFLWVLKAFLEVLCTIGSVVFVSILLIRGIWTGVTYVQERREERINGLVDDQHAWSGAQPAS